MKLLYILFLLPLAADAQTRVSGGTNYNWSTTEFASLPITVPNVVAGNLIVGCARWASSAPLPATVSVTDGSGKSYAVDSIGAFDTTSALPGVMILWHAVALETAASVTYSVTPPVPGGIFWASAAEQYSSAGVWTLDQSSTVSSGATSPATAGPLSATNAKELAVFCPTIALPGVTGTFAGLQMSVAQSDTPNGYIGLLDLALANPTTGLFSATSSALWGAVGATFNATVPPVVTPPSNSAFIPVRNEQPAFALAVNTTSGGNYGTYTLLHTPLYGVSCFVAGQRQFPAAYPDPFGIIQPSYILTGAVLTSAYWDVISGSGAYVFCDYEYAPGT
jgi:hypothetical protein